MDESDLNDVDEDGESRSDDEIDRRALLAGLFDRARAAGISADVREERRLILGDDGSVREADQQVLVLNMPRGRDTREVRFAEFDTGLVDLKQSRFEAYRFVEGYEAIWSESLGIVECELVPLEPFATAVIRRLTRDRGIVRQAPTPLELQPEEKEQVLHVPIPAGGPDIRIGTRSAEHAALCAGGRHPTLALLDADVHTHDEARELLERIGNSTLFQFDLNFGAGFYLGEERTASRPRRPRGLGTQNELTAPQYEYDNEPMALYWYARSARGMPLVQYLAFYQCLEFYFPIYAQREAQEIIRDRLKDPRFNPARDSDLSKLLGAIRASTVGGRSFGDERAQLRATLLGCLTAEEVREFVCQYDDRRDFFSSKKGKGLPSDQRLSVQNPATDLRLEVAERIYDVRCRIVHTKNSEEGGILLPFSQESRNMAYDLELIAFAAREVLIRNSRPIRF